MNRPRFGKRSRSRVWEDRDVEEDQAAEEGQAVGEGRDVEEDQAAEEGQAVGEGFGPLIVSLSSYA